MTLSQYFQWFMWILVGRGSEKTNPIQSQTKPNKANLLSFCVLRTAKGNLKKQSQFADGTNRRKVFSERKLWQYYDLWGTKKQSQFKPNLQILTDPAVNREKLCNRRLLSWLQCVIVLLKPQ